jgi:hypothetical protein
LAYRSRRIEKRPESKKWQGRGHIRSKSSRYTIIPEVHINHVNGDGNLSEIEIYNLNYVRVSIFVNVKNWILRFRFNYYDSMIICLCAWSLSVHRPARLTHSVSHILTQNNLIRPHRPPCLTHSTSPKKTFHDDNGFIVILI